MTRVLMALTLPVRTAAGKPGDWRTGGPVFWCPAPAGRRRSAAGLVHVVEGRLTGPPEAGEARVGHQLPDGRLARLRTQGVAAGLGHRVRHAQERGEAVVDPADRVQVVRDRVPGGR